MLLVSLHFEVWKRKRRGRRGWLFLEHIVVKQTMPHYKQVICCLPKYPPSALVGLFKRHTSKVYEVGGVVRSIDNHGLREFTEKAHRCSGDVKSPFALIGTVVNLN